MDFVNLSINSKQSKSDWLILPEMQALFLLEYHILLLYEWHVQHEFTEKRFAAFQPPQLHPSAVYHLRKEEYLDQLPVELMHLQL